MHKFRSEAWCRSFDQQRDWTTCYDDSTNGWGHFYAPGGMYHRKQPGGQNSYYLNYLEKKNYQKPNKDHMWGVLHVWDSNSNVNSHRERLRRILRDKYRQRLVRSCPPPVPEQPTEVKAQRSTDKATHILKLPPVNTREDQENANTRPNYSHNIKEIQERPKPGPRVGWTSYQHRGKGVETTGGVSVANENEFNTRVRSQDQDVKRGAAEWYSAPAGYRMRVAGLPTVWQPKQRHKTDVPPPYVPQPIPLPMHVTFSSRKASQSLNVERGNHGHERRMNLEYVLVPKWRNIQSSCTQTGRPETGLQFKLAQSAPALPSIRCEEPPAYLSQQPLRETQVGQTSIAYRNAPLPQIVTAN